MTHDARKPRVSIVTPTYNCAALLKKAIASVRAQSIPDWEMIIVNNFSEDDTHAVVEAFADERLKLLDFRNHGVIAASRNLGIQHAAGEWVAFLDADDFWAPNKLEVCLARADAGVGAVIHDVWVKFADAKRGPRLKPCMPADASYKTLLFGINTVTTSATMVRTELLHAQKGFCEDQAIVTAEDFDLWLRLLANGCRFAAVHAALGTILVQNSSASRAIERHFLASKTVYERHYQSLKPRTWVDALRYQRIKSLTTYSAARAYQSRGDRANALRFFGRSLREYPVNARAYAGLAILAGQGI